MTLREHRSVGSGRTVVFVHATLLDGSQWDELVSHTPEATRAVAVDLPEIAFDAPGTTLATLEAAFDEFVTRVAPEVTLVGHSLGAWLVARSLSRLGEHVRSAVLVSGLERLPAEMASVYTQLAAGLESGAVSRHGVLDAIASAALGKAGSQAAREWLLERMGRAPVERMIRMFRLVAELGLPHARVARYSTRATVLHAREDASVPLALGRALAELGGAPLELVETDSHVLPLTHARRVAELAFQ